MSDQKIEPCLNIDPKNTRTAKIIEPRYGQLCMLCNNTREIPSPMHYQYPWVCSDCKDAIAFIKEFKVSIKNNSSQVPRQGLPKTEIMPL